jgi:hypothetical protein
VALAHRWSWSHGLGPGREAHKMGLFVGGFLLSPLFLKIFITLLFTHGYKGQRKTNTQ